jgi:sec-independent protein translocase protein TatA
MGSLGMGELLVILVIVIVVFGASKLPQLGDALGKSIKNFKRATSQQDEIDVTPKQGELPRVSTPVDDKKEVH